MGTRRTKNRSGEAAAPKAARPELGSAPWWLRLLAYTRIPGNILAYWARGWLPGPRACPALPGEELTELFRTWPLPLREAAERREEELRARYRLVPLRAHCSRFVYLKALWSLAVWEEAMAAAGPATTARTLERRELQVVDVGSMNWEYVFALERFWRHYAETERARPGVGRRIRLLGVEVNGQARDHRGVTHAAQAHAYAAQTGNDLVRYRVRNFLAVGREELRSEGADVVTVFFPFLFHYGALLWGLPPWLCRPEAILRQARALLRPGGLLFLLVHTPDEYRRLRTLAARLPELRVAAAGPAHCPLFPHGAPPLMAGRHYLLLVHETARG